MKKKLLTLGLAGLMSIGSAFADSPESLKSEYDQLQSELKVHTLAVGTLCSGGYIAGLTQAAGAGYIAMVTGALDSAYAAGREGWYQFRKAGDRADEYFKVDSGSAPTIKLENDDFANTKLASKFAQEMLDKAIENPGCRQALGNFDENYKRQREIGKAYRNMTHTNIKYDGRDLTDLRLEYHKRRTATRAAITAEVLGQCIGEKTIDSGTLVASLVISGGRFIYDAATYGVLQLHPGSNVDAFAVSKAGAQFNADKLNEILSGEACFGAVYKYSINKEEIVSLDKEIEARKEVGGFIQGI